MKLHAFEISRDAALRPVDIRVGDERVRDGSANPLWVSLEIEEGESPDEGWLERLGLSAAVREWVMRLPHASPVRRHERMLLFVFPCTEPAPVPGGEAGPVWFVCGPRLLVTIRRGSAALLDELVRDVTGEGVTGSGGIPSLVYEILDRLAEPIQDRAARARQWVRELWLGADENREGTGIDQVLLAKREVDRLLSVLEDAFHCVNGLLQEDAPSFQLVNDRERYRALGEGLTHLHRSVGRLEVRLTHMQDNYELALHERTSRRLNVLTIVQAIFVPLTLIAGVYGMNLQHMPGLQSPAAFPLVLAAMGLLALGILALFWRSGWLE